jgi:hypothetical protein
MKAKSAKRQNLAGMRLQGPTSSVCCLSSSRPSTRPLSCGPSPHALHCILSVPCIHNASLYCSTTHGQSRNASQDRPRKFANPEQCAAPDFAAPYLRLPNYGQLLPATGLSSRCILQTAFSAQSLRVLVLLKTLRATRSRKMVNHGVSRACNTCKARRKKVSTPREPYKC